MRVIAFDLATCTGFALCEPGRRIESGSFMLGMKRSSHGQKFQYLEQTATAMIDRMKPTHVAYEKPLSHNYAELTIGLKAIIELVCEKTKTPYLNVPVMTLKKYITGVGKANKQAMIDAAWAHWGHRPMDDNEADALGVAKWAIENIED